MEMPEFAPGSAARVELLVTDADTAQAVGSGDVPVLGGPRLLALAEAATVATTARQIPGGLTTVSTRVELEHHHPVPVGHRVVAEARLAGSAGHTLIFDVTVHAGETLVAVVRIERAVLDRRRFIAESLS